MFIFTIETIVTATLIALIIIFSVGSAIINGFKQGRCPHESIRETMACDAICNKCNKNLGFIGAWRDSQNKA